MSTALLLAAVAAAAAAVDCDEAGEPLEVSSEVALDPGPDMPGLGTVMQLRGPRLVVGNDNPMVFELDEEDTSVWRNAGVLERVSAPTLEGYGSSVSVAGDTAAVGCDGGDDILGDSRVYIFSRLPNGDWTETASFLPPSMPLGGSEHFGSSVDLSDDGTVLLVGSRQDIGSTGRAFVFERQADNTWDRVATLSPGVSSMLGASFGASVDLSGNRAIVGGPGAAAPGIGVEQETGSFAVFEASSLGSWTRIALVRYDQDDARLGSIVALSQSGEIAAVTARGEGAVYLYSVTEDSVTRTAAITAPSGSSGFATSMAMSGDDFVAVGSTGDVYVYQICTGVLVQLASVSSPISQFIGQDVKMDAGLVATSDLSGNVVLASLGVREFLFDDPPLAALSILRPQTQVNVGPVTVAARGGILPPSSTCQVSVSTDGGDSFALLTTQASSPSEDTTELVFEFAALPLTPIPSTTMVLRFILADIPLSPELFFEIEVDECNPDGLLTVAPDDSSMCTCLPGAFLAVTGLCEPCAPGFYREDPGFAGCVACGDGQSTAEPGAASVLECVCASGTFDDGEGGCVSCPEGSTSPVGALSRDDCECLEGTYEDPTSDDFACLPCPTGAICPGGNAETVVADVGFFVLPRDDGSPAVLSCPYPGRCRGNNECATGYEGIACAACADGYGGVSTVCLECPPAGANEFLLALSVLIALVAIMVLLKSATVPGTKASTAGRVALSFVQILVVVSQFSTKQSIATLAGLAGTLQPSSQVLSVECAVEMSVVTKAIVMMALPAIVLGIVAVAGAVRLALGAVRRAQAWSDAQLHACFLLYLIHPAVTQGALSTMRCRDYGPAGRRLALDVNVECDTPAHDGLLAFAVLYFIFYCIGMLAATAMALRRWPAHPALLFLRSGYREGLEYWELASAGRKLCIMVISVLVVDNPSGQLFLALMIVSTALMANSKTRPYSSRSISTLEDFALLVLLLTIGSASMFHANDADASFEVFVVVLVMTANCVMLAVFAVYVVRELRRAGTLGAIGRKFGRHRDDEASGVSSGDSAL